MASFLNFESIVLITVGGLLFYGTYTWTADYLESAKKESEQNRERMSKCSSLEIRFIDREVSNGTTEVFFTVNHRLEAVKLDFTGPDNSTDIIRDVEKNTIYSASADSENVSEVEATAKECSELPN